MVRREPLGCAALTEVRAERLDVLESFGVAVHLPLAPARAYDDHYLSVAWPAGRRGAGDS
jgi:hypothetical protein